MAMSKRKRQKPKNQALSKQESRTRHARDVGQSTTSGLLWIFGLHAVCAALENPERVCLQLMSTRNADKNLPAQSKLECITSSAADIEQILPLGAVHQGVALLVEPLPDLELEDICRTETQGPIVILDQVTDAQNVGAILRSCAAFEALALVVQQRHSPPISGLLAKAASGALEHVPMIRVTNLARCLDEIGDLGFHRIGLTQDGHVSLAKAKTEAPTALILGAEGAGLRRLTREKCDVLTKLPTSPTQPSLNVSNAAAVALYELSGGSQNRD